MDDAPTCCTAFQTTRLHVSYEASALGGHFDSSDKTVSPGVTSMQSQTKTSTGKARRRYMQDRGTSQPGRGSCSQISLAVEAVFGEQAKWTSNLKASDSVEMVTLEISTQDYKIQNCHSCGRTFNPFSNHLYCPSWPRQRRTSCSMSLEL